MEIGTAYGLATLEALSKGAKIVANDLHQIHLDVLALRSPKHLHKNLRLLSGAFEKIDMKEQETFHSILACRVLHFMNGKSLTKTLKKIHALLSPKGKIFLIVDTPYMGWWTKCIPIFEEKKRIGHQWPGIFIPAKNYCNNLDAHPALPKLVHWFDKTTIADKVKQSGFQIEAISYLDRKGSYPESCCLNGKESVGLIASKSN